MRRDFLISRIGQVKFLELITSTLSRISFIMKVPTVDRFLCYFDLTTGGLILGYIGAIINAALVLVILKDLLIDYREFKRVIFGSISEKNEVIVDEGVEGTTFEEYPDSSEIKVEF